MKAAIAGLMLVASAAYAEPRANSVEECAAYADLGLVASTLAKHGVTRSMTEDMLPDMYELKNPDAQEIARLIVDAAYSMGRTARPDPRTFASVLGTTCVRSQGRMDAILGVKL